MKQHCANQVGILRRRLAGRSTEERRSFERPPREKVPCKRCEDRVPAVLVSVEYLQKSAVRHGERGVRNYVKVKGILFLRRYPVAPKAKPVARQSSMNRILQLCCSNTNVSETQRRSMRCHGVDYSVMYDITVLKQAEGCWRVSDRLTCTHR